jgi:hypothetical protein
MFADGVALEVDVDEERVEMVEQDGSVVRYGCSFSSSSSSSYVRTSSTDERPPRRLFADVPCVNAVPAGRSAIA